MISCRMGSSLNQQSNHGIMGEQQGLEAISSSSSSEVSSVGSVSESLEEVSDSASSSSPTSPSSGSASLSGQLSTGPLSDMSLLQLLSFKRGLSKHYNGKSQSFFCLSHVSSVEDLAKPENPYNKKLKSWKSYAGGLSESQKSKHLPNGRTTSSRLISKKASGGSCSSLSAKRNGSLLGNSRPTI